MQAAFVFIDLLGFSEYTREDLGGVARLLESQRIILNTRLSDEKWYKARNTQVTPFARARLATSFEHFLPFSDSICIASSDPNLFLRQLAEFLRHAFLYTGHAFGDRTNSANPTAIDMRVIGLDGTSRETQNWYPVLWRGGMSYGKVEIVETSGLVEKKPLSLPLLVGEPVVEAVGLERCGGKGPRLFCRPDFRRNISDSDLLPYFVPVGSLPEKAVDVEEFLWTGCNFDNDGDFDAEFRMVSELLEPAMALWIARRGKDAEQQYREFVLLVIRGALKWAETRQRRADALVILRGLLVAFRHESVVDEIMALV